MNFEELKQSVRADEEYLNHNLETLRKNYQKIIDEKIKNFLDTVPVNTIFYKKAEHGFVNKLDYRFYREDKVCFYSQDLEYFVIYDFGDILSMEMED